MFKLHRAAVMTAAAACAVAFIPGVAAQAAPQAESGVSSARFDIFVGEGRGKLREALREAESDAYQQARRKGYDRRDCETGSIDRYKLDGNQWRVKHIINCDDDGNGGGGDNPPVRDILVNAGSGLCFDATRRMITVEKCDGNRGQRVTVNRRDGSIRVLGECVQTGGRDSIELERCNGSDEQDWDVVGRDEPVQLRNDDTRECLAVIERHNEEGAEIGVDDCDSRDEDQQWFIGDAD